MGFEPAQELEVARLGLDGEGRVGGLRAPFALPGERVGGVEADGIFAVRAILRASPDRVAPVCRHFGVCGGCALQHASDGFLAEWKRGAVVRALAARGIVAAEFRPTLTSPPGTRRRAVFGGRRTKKTVVVGFHARRSETLLDVTECPLVRPALLAAKPALVALTRLGASRSRDVRLSVTDAAAGLDVDVGGGKALDGDLRHSLAALAEAHDLARLAWDGEVVAQRRAPVQAFGAATVLPPPGAFLQATAEGEAALVAAVREAVGGARRVADLFAGCGAFTLPLAREAEVHAVEGDAAMLAALAAGWRQARDLRRVSTEARDLFRRPLLPGELGGFDAVVIDPPRAGAEAQARTLAASGVPRIAAVSCSPVSFARDAAILVAGGYRLDWVQVIDQFRWSGHVELAAQFSRQG